MSAGSAAAAPRGSPRSSRWRRAARSWPSARPRPRSPARREDRAGREATVLVTTLALASLAASASAAMALWSWTGSRTSLLQQRRIVRRGATVLYCTVLYCIVTVLYSHLHALHLHAPGVRGVVQRGLHPLRDLLPAAGRGIEGAVRLTADS